MSQYLRKLLAEQRDTNNMKPDHRNTTTVTKATAVTSSSTSPPPPPTPPRRTTVTPKKTVGARSVGNQEEGDEGNEQNGALRYSPHNNNTSPPPPRRYHHHHHSPQSAVANNDADLTNSVTTATPPPPCPFPPRRVPHTTSIAARIPMEVVAPPEIPTTQPLICNAGSASSSSSPCRDVPWTSGVWRPRTPWVTSSSSPSIGIHQDSAKCLEYLLSQYPWIVYLGFSFWRKCIIFNCVFPAATTTPLDCSLLLRRERDRFEKGSSSPHAVPDHAGVFGAIQHIAPRGKLFSYYNIPSVYFRKRRPLSFHRQRLPDDGDNEGVEGWDPSRVQEMLLRQLIATDQVDCLFILASALQLNIGTCDITPETRGVTGFHWAAMCSERVTSFLLHTTFYPTFPSSSGAASWSWRRNGTCSGEKECSATGDGAGSAVERAFSTAGRSSIDQHRSHITDRRDSRGYTALHFAALCGCGGAARVLIREAQADVNATTLGGDTPLHKATLSSPPGINQTKGGEGDNSSSGNDDGSGGDGCVAVAELLLQSGADVTARNHTGHTALHEAANTGNSEVIQLLLLHNNAEEGGTTTSAELSAPSGRGTENSQKATSRRRRGPTSGGGGGVTKVADVNAMATNGWTPLHVAGWKGHLEAAKALLECPEINDPFSKGVGAAAATCSPYEISSKAVKKLIQGRDVEKEMKKYEVRK